MCSVPFKLYVLTSVPGISFANVLFAVWDTRVEQVSNEESLQFVVLNLFTKLSFLHILHNIQ